ncbi:hypothetical protein EDB87DRAFT_1569732, partial [Lactarius vividus]
CPDCKALHWLAERLTKSSMRNPKFGMCCFSGKISLPPLQSPPLELSQLLISQDQLSKAFRLHIRNYNSALAMTSVGRKLDDSVNQRGGGPYTFRLHGELIHRAGSLLPPEGDQVAPVYAQLYIYDSDVALNHHMTNAWNSNLDQFTLGTLQDMCEERTATRQILQLYRQAYEMTSAMPPDQQCQISLHFDPTCDRQHYQALDASVKEIAVILPGDGDQPTSAQDIILYCKHGPPLQCISDIHPFYPSLHYVLLYPTGQLSWHPNILYQHVVEGTPHGSKRIRVSMVEYHNYCLFICPTDVESNHLFLTGKLFQGFILPSSFSGSTHNMQQHYQDALAINHYFGGGDLFHHHDSQPCLA